ncbi:outer membrane beta-barrel protein [Acetobacter conturbans]|uniref:outer membrane beta-barrel protein n=1 Tax=Acetobacter conturbans TaxID=1737472 RepID=UPI001567E543
MVGFKARDEQRAAWLSCQWLFLVMIILGIGYSPRANAQLINQYFPSELPGYSSDATGTVSLKEILLNQHPGIPVGAYFLKPAASQQFGYNTNILGAPHTAGPMFITNASLGMNSNWTRHAIGASVSVANQAYPTLAAAGYTDWNASAGGSVDLGRDVASLGYSHAVKHLYATDLGNFGISYPVPYTSDDVRLSYRKNWTRFALIPSAAYDNFSFGNSAGTLPTAARNTALLSHQLETQMLQGRFEVSKGNAIVAILRGSEAQYRTKPGVVPSDYIGGGGFLGIDLRSDPVLQYRAMVGGETRYFTRGGGRPITTPTAELNILWLPNQMNTFTLTGQRGLFDPTSPFSRNQTMSTVSLLWDRELRRDIIFHGDIGLSRTDSRATQANASALQQTQSKFAASIDWLFTRDLKLTVQYSHLSSYMKHGIPAVLATGNSRATFTSNTFTFGISFVR